MRKKGSSVTQFTPCKDRVSLNCCASIPSERISYTRLGGLRDLTTGGGGGLAFKGPGVGRGEGVEEVVLLWEGGGGLEAF